MRKKRSERTILIEKIDSLFSKGVRKRFNYVCQRCKAKHAENSRGLHCSHYWGRARKSTRWSFKNCIALCYGCHRRWEGDKQGEYQDFMIEYLGQKEFDILKIRANMICSYSLADLKVIYMLAWQERWDKDVFE